MASAQKTAAVVTAALDLVSEVLPVAGTVIQGLRLIWQAQNPGKTEAEWLASLSTDAATLTSEADAILARDGIAIPINPPILK